MLNKIVTLAAVVVLAALLTPSRVGAWGAAHVGVTRVGPFGGVVHVGRTVVPGPGAMWAGSHVGAIGPWGRGYRAGWRGPGGPGAGWGRYRYGWGGVGGFRGRYGWVR